MGQCWNALMAWKTSAGRVHRWGPTSSCAKHQKSYICSWFWSIPLFVALHLEYINLTPQTTLGVLCKGHIIVHSHLFDHQYGWNLDSFAHLYDIDKKLVHGEANFIPIIILLTTILEAAPYTHLPGQTCAIFREPLIISLRSQLYSLLRGVPH